MTRNCLNVMRKIANGLQAAGKGGAAGSVLGGLVGSARPGVADPMPGSVGYRINQQQRASNPSFMNSPFMTNLRRAGRSAFNTVMAGMPVATHVPPKSQPMSVAPTGSELYQAQKQVDARRDASGLPPVYSRYNRPWSGIVYDPKMRNQLGSLLTSSQSVPGGELVRRLMQKRPQ